MSTDDLTREIANLDHEIGAMQATKATLEAKRVAWPMRATVVASVPESERYCVALNLGLAQAAVVQFADGLAYMVLELEVSTDGTFTVLTCHGQRLLPKE